MSILRKIWVCCDGPRCKESAGPFNMLFFDAGQIRVRLNAAGWKQVGSQDYCPRHWMPLNRGPKKGGK